MEKCHLDSGWLECAMQKKKLDWIRDAATMFFQQRALQEHNGTKTCADNLMGIADFESIVNNSVKVVQARQSAEQARSASLSASTSARLRMEAFLKGRVCFEVSYMEAKLALKSAFAQEDPEEELAHNNKLELDRNAFLCSPDIMALKDAIVSVSMALYLMKEKNATEGLEVIHIVE